MKNEDMFCVERSEPGACGFQENVHLDCGGSAGRDADARRVHGSHAHPHRQVHMSKSIPLFFAVLGSFGTRSLDVDA